MVQRQLSLFPITDPLPIRVTAKGIEVFIKVTPKASKDRLGKIMADSAGNYVLKAYVTAPPEDNQANECLIRFLSKEWRLPKSCIQIINGLASRQKTILLTGVNEGEVKNILGAY
ncbi:MAG: DUF167 domain-containing protein [Alphaproteobacteria bacterium]|nr:DUF167 domain-containing protein [Alphaproteobacteria bacterium]